MAIEVRMLTLGPVQTNSYVVGDTTSGSAVVIDPVDDARRILKVAQDAGWTIRLILATHAHFDHVLAARELKALTGAPFRLHEADRTLLDRLQESGRTLLGLELPEPAEPDSYVREGDVIEVGDIWLETRFTPGHTPGHVSYVMVEPPVVFCGDCLFHGSIGRTDLPGADYETLMRSIFGQLLSLDDDYTVAPGHGQTTTIGQERLSNPFILEYQD